MSDTALDLGEGQTNRSARTVWAERVLDRLDIAVLVHCDGRPLACNRWFADLIGAADVSDVLARDHVPGLPIPEALDGVVRPTLWVKADGTVMIDLAAEKILFDGFEAVELRWMTQANGEAVAVKAALAKAHATLYHCDRLVSLGRIQGGIAHEIKNPLNFVNNFALLCLDQLQDLREFAAEPDSRDFMDVIETLAANIEKIREHGTRADSIVRGVLRHLRGNNDWRATDLNALVDEVFGLAWHGARAIEPALEVISEVKTDPAIDRITLRADSISRAFLNLLNNAFEAVIARQRQAKLAKSSYVGRVSIETSAHPDYALVRILDNGTGIANTVKSALFTPFFTTKPEGTGIGLGLVIARQVIVADHHGTLEIESDGVSGTCVTMTLPWSGQGR